MSLNIFETIEEIPQGVEYIKSNDLFFDAKGNIPNSEFAEAFEFLADTMGKN
jgi:hypothetical protein